MRVAETGGLVTRRPAIHTGLAILIALLLVGCGILPGPVSEPTSESTLDQQASTLLVSVLDVGQAMCVAVISPDGHAMLIDGGRSQERVEEVVVPYLEDHGVSSIDYLVLSHPDQDHVGGLPRLLEMMEVATFVDPVIPSTNQTYEEVLTMIQDLDISPMKARRSMELDLGDNVTADILWPRDPLLTSGDEVDSNTNSIVLRIEYGDVVVLVPGDAEKEAELELVEMDDGELESDVLVAGHHGSNTSSQGAFLDAVSPRVAVIPVGFDNQYGHPHDEVVQRMRLRDIEIYRTDLDGTVELITDGTTITVNQLGTESRP